jgi:glutamate carboxypeptidase
MKRVIGSARWARQRGWELKRWKDDQAGDTIAFTIRGRSRPRILLAAHLDTVYPVGIATQRPMRIEGDTLFAPGSCDNKSGLLSALYAMAALEECRWSGNIGAITLLCGGDEETDMRVSRLAFARTRTPARCRAWYSKPAAKTVILSVPAKAARLFSFEVQGKAAHAGVEPHKGANAIVQLAHQSVALHALNGLRPGVTVNVGVVSGGTVSNAVPDFASAKIDVRIVDPADQDVVTAAILQIAATNHVAGARPPPSLVASKCLPWRVLRKSPRLPMSPSRQRLSWVFAPMMPTPVACRMPIIWLN